MIEAIPLQEVVAVLLVMAVGLASLRLLIGAWREAQVRPRAWRIAALLGLQAGSALLLWFTLWPPTRPIETGTMVVLTERADASPTALGGEFVVALPEAGPTRGATRVPDLATALRQHPGVRRLRIAGAGLTARDREAVDGRALAFDAAPLPRGLVELWFPHRVQAGAAFTVRGRVNAVDGAWVELRDPADRRSDRAKVDMQGRFTLGAIALSEGLAQFQLHVLDAGGASIETAAVPLDITVAEAHEILFLAGGPSPELKYLRRWASDAGLSQHANISVGGGMDIGDGAPRFDAEGLGQFDFVVLDERAWSGLDASRAAALRAALRDGLGVLLRIDGPLSGAARTRLRGLGFELRNARIPTAVRLPADISSTDASPQPPAAAGPATGPGADAVDGVPATMPMLSRQSVRIVTDDGAPLLRDASGETLATWRAEGRGRIAVWTLADSYRLVLTGHRDRHARLWGEALSILARPRRAASPRIVGEAVEGERIVLCGVASGARMVEPDGTRTLLLRDPRVAQGSCAGYWPGAPGWHTLQIEAPARQPWRLHVRPENTLPGVRALAMREATARLASGTVPEALPTTLLPGPRWPWLLGWLAASGVLWWLERSRLGRRAGTDNAL